MSEQNKDDIHGFVTQLCGIFQILFTCLCWLMGFCFHIRQKFIVQPTLAFKGATLVIDHSKLTDINFTLLCTNAFKSNQINK